MPERLPLLPRLELVAELVLRQSIDSRGIYH